MNPSVVADKLETLLMQLRAFDNTLANQFNTAESAWSSLDSVWDGYAYEDFQGNWNRTRQMFNYYLSTAHEYEHFLSERIIALRKLERGS